MFEEVGVAGWQSRRVGLAEPKQALRSDTDRHQSRFPALNSFWRPTSPVARLEVASTRWAGGVDPSMMTESEPRTQLMKLSASTKEWSIRIIWTKSERKPKGSPRRALPGDPGWRVHSTKFQKRCALGTHCAETPSNPRPVMPKLSAQLFRSRRRRLTSLSAQTR